MGLEGECECDCNGVRSRVKALIEPPDLILRGALRRRIPLSELKQIQADGDVLRFASGNDRFSLAVGNATAERWARALRTPPPDLAKKLGISADTIVRIIGKVDDDALRAALASANAVAEEDAEIIVARVNTPAEVVAALHTAATPLQKRVPIWFIYPKGRGHALTENDVRATALAAGIVDTKVCAVSPTLTGLRFVRRKSE
jgi:hypothetical protein